MRDSDRGSTPLKGGGGTVGRRALSRAGQASVSANGFVGFLTETAGTVGHSKSYSVPFPWLFLIPIGETAGQMGRCTLRPLEPQGLAAIFYPLSRVFRESALKVQTTPITQLQGGPAGLRKELSSHV